MCRLSIMLVAAFSLCVIRLSLGAEPDARVVKIVSSLPRVGPAKGQTDALVNGIKLALEEAEHKAEAFKVEYKDLDDADAKQGWWSAEREAANARKAVEDERVLAWIGPYNSGAAKISMPILNEAQLLMVSPGCTYPGLTKAGYDPDEPAIYRPGGKVNFVRLPPTDEGQGTIAADFAKSLGVKAVYVLDDGEVYGRMTAGDFRKRCERLGLKVLGSSRLDHKARSHRVLAAKLKEAAPDLVYFGGTSQTGAGQLCKDLVAAGPNCPLVVPDGCYEHAFLTSAGQDTFNRLTCYITFSGLGPDQLTSTEEGKGFSERYQKRFSAKPEVYSAYGYEAARVALEAIRKAAKKDRAAVTEACLAQKEYRSVFGPYRFDENGDCSVQPFVVTKVQDGDFKFVKVLDAREPAAQNR
jgi:branched-chain amino acid transport system substrate-binding protein